MERKEFEEKFKEILSKNNHVLVYFGDDGEVITAENYLFVSDIIGKPLNDNERIGLIHNHIVIANIKFSKIKRLS